MLSDQLLHKVSENDMHKGEGIFGADRVKMIVYQIIKKIV
jgi:hypothetical protein